MQRYLFVVDVATFWHRATFERLHHLTVIMLFMSCKIETSGLATIFQ